MTLSTPNTRSPIVIYTDGACSGNPGPGGWAAVVQTGAAMDELYGYEPHTTNQRMELRAAIAGLRATPAGARVVVYSDSAYLVNAFLQKWTENWRRNGWLNARKQPVENQDLWRELLSLVEARHVEWKKVKGHANDALNNRCDALARQAIADGLAARI